MIAVENILTRANYFNLSDPTVVLYWRAGGGLEISKRNRGIPPLVQAILVTTQPAAVCVNLEFGFNIAVCDGKNIAAIAMYSK